MSTHACSKHVGKRPVILSRGPMLHVSPYSHKSQCKLQKKEKGKEKDSKEDPSGFENTLSAVLGAQRLILILIISEMSRLLWSGREARPQQTDSQTP